jgi:hypothetical protein
VTECNCLQTTPPCAEGLRWHLFTTHIPIPLSTVRQYESTFVNITDPVTGTAPTEKLPFCMYTCSVVRLHCHMLLLKVALHVFSSCVSCAASFSVSQLPLCYVQTREAFEHSAARVLPAFLTLCGAMQERSNCTATTTAP